MSNVWRTSGSIARFGDVRRVETSRPLSDKTVGYLRLGETWLDNGQLTDADKAALGAALTNYERTPDESSSWEQVSAPVRAKLRTLSVH